MSYSNRSLSALAVILGLAGFYLLGAPIEACGPFFPNTILDKSDKEILRTPLADFRWELDQIRLPGKPLFRAAVPEGSEAQQTESADIADLRKALGIPADRENDLLKKYAAAREKIREYSEKFTEWQMWNQEEKVSPRPVMPDIVIPEGLPAEFASYTLGAIEYHKRNAQGAVAHWKALLALPAKERHYRSTWAAFMTGKTLLGSKPAEAAKCFARVRELAGAGFADTLGLAASSYGWEAKAELDQKHYARAMELYLTQHATEDYSAIASLRIVASRTLKSGGKELEAAATHEVSRRVINAHLVSNIGPYQGYLYAPRRELVASWLKAAEAVKAKNMAGAEHLARMAYRSGDMDSAARWLERAPRDAPIAQWIGAKLLLRDGKLDEAAAMLAKVIKALPAPKPGECWEEYYDELEDASSNARASGELAILRMARSQYAEALDLLLRADFWMDGAYAAERVLTPEELIAYVDSHWPEPEKDKGDSVEEDSEKVRLAETRGKIRYLLARRLARLERWKEARAYYPGRWRSRFDRYAKTLEDGRNRKRTRDERAKSLWEAAGTARWFGMELLGTEVEPDWHVYSGGYDPGSSAKRRLEAAGKNKVALVTTDERKRLEKHKAGIDKRFHYRYIAAELGWAAAELMPDNTDETARVLCETGTWLKDRDPQAADRFYKALVIRCRKTRLGREADKLRWFPKLKEDK